jgi:hypothetical protein
MPQPAVGDKGTAFALGAEPVILQRHQHGVGVAVIELTRSDIVACDARHPECHLAGPFRTGFDCWMSRGEQIVARCAGRVAQYMHRRLPQVACAFR